LFAPASSANETPISAQYAGSGWDTHIDGFAPDGSNVSLTTATGQCTFGDHTLTITTEWQTDDAVTCPTGFPLKYSLIYSASVLTFQDRSQLFGISQSGWICATNEGQYFGKVRGIYAGGTGRFKVATGDFVSKFNGTYLEPNLGFRSIRGTVEGTVSRN
jgi:hypothetical protein